MKNDFIKFCKYYKGDDTPPNGDPYNDFYILERNYVTGVHDHDYWETDGLRMCIDSFPETKDFIYSHKDVEVRGMLANFVIMQMYNAPQTGTDFIFKYGK